jgi:hypothetical protein
MLKEICRLLIVFVILMTACSAAGEQANNISAGQLEQNAIKTVQPLLPTDTQQIPSTDTPLPSRTPRPSETKVPTNTPLPSSIPMPTDTSEPSETPVSSSTLTPMAEGLSQVVISTIFYDGTGQKEPDEYVEIRNNGTSSIQLAGWSLRDKAEHVFIFPSFELASGQVCRVYTNEEHPDWCGFNYRFTGSAIWNNGGDCAYLRDGALNLIEEYCY